MTEQRPTDPRPDKPDTLDTVRTAWPTESTAIAPIQRRVWNEQWSRAEVEHLLAGTDLDDMVASWHRAIVAPPDARCRVLVALEGERVVGFAATGPSDDDDAQPRDGLVVEFVIDPTARGRGHGSRLMNAVVDTLRTDGFHTVSWWIRSTDDRLRAFLGSAGWAPDGASRQFTTDDEEVTTKEVRLRSAIVEQG